MFTDCSEANRIHHVITLSRMLNDLCNEPEVLCKHKCSSDPSTDDKK